MCDIDDVFLALVIAGCLVRGVSMCDIDDVFLALVIAGYLVRGVSMCDAQWLKYNKFGVVTPIR